MRSKPTVIAGASSGFRCEIVAVACDVGNAHAVEKFDATPIARSSSSTRIGERP